MHLDVVRQSVKGFERFDHSRFGHEPESKRSSNLPGVPIPIPILYFISKVFHASWLV